jgi:hypothetical protein
VKQDNTSHILWVSPHRHEASMYDGIHLRGQWHGVLSVVLALVVRGTATVGDNILDFVAEFLVLGRFCPHVAPVFALIVGVASAYSLQHIFRGVLLRRAFLCAVVLEVVKERAAVLAELSEVDGAAARLEKEQLVKLFEEDG